MSSEIKMDYKPEILIYTISLSRDIMSSTSFHKSTKKSYKWELLVTLDPTTKSPNVNYPLKVINVIVVAQLLYKQGLVVNNAD